MENEASAPAAQPLAENVELGPVAAPIRSVIELPVMSLALSVNASHSQTRRIAYRRIPELPRTIFQPERRLFRRVNPEPITADERRVKIQKRFVGEQMSKNMFSLVYVFVWSETNLFRFFAARFA